MPSEKEPVVAAAETLLQKAEDCFAISNGQRLEAESQHENASRQMANAAVQQDIAAKQHRDADALESQAKMLDGLGHSLEADAVKLAGQGQVGKPASAGPGNTDSK